MEELPYVIYLWKLSEVRICKGGTHKLVAMKYFHNVLTSGFEGYNRLFIDGLYAT